MRNLAVTNATISKVKNGLSIEKPDLLAVEEPLEIRVGFGDTLRKEKKVAVTMRTPGHDFELALGFLFTEGLIQPKDVVSIKHCQQVKPEEEGNVVRVELKPDANIELEGLERNFYTTSSCGVCGKASIESIHQKCAPLVSDLIIDEHIIHASPNVLREAQNVFEHTGGLHAVGLFDSSGKLILLREDIGRHNAFDKLVGAALNAGIDSSEHFVLVSGRASFELVQKSVMAGIPIMAAVGAPSSLAVDLAEKSNLTLLGFVRNNSFNVYTGAQRVQSSKLKVKS
ncbi:formate dehydrogenase accessory sulfurtransferase FdhD [Fulvivirga lutea]|uniref:Sulfur carrier protein FdhD n=1 Tax=Fulvivirga lutea TaxID=2810512 RepID=A0A974WH77_9BACT|nr:formate dehydrogenase accessory sulfurtransferase FdhD [Fulvivirga lutea]QSE96050.1 formate dehydrogenase accessory sulfurtransferase FdhD [Fulvivirga lutea]